MTTLIAHDACLDHRPGHGHPEHPGRLSAVLDSLDGAGLHLNRIVAPTASRDDLLRIHTPEVLDRVLGRDITEPTAIDADTVMSAGSAEATLRATGAVIEGVDRVIAGDTQRVFCAVRPPGHHAESARSMGFCLFNAIAAGAAHAMDALDRIAIVDFDVHHGNGTQEIFYHQPRVHYASSHQSPLYPGTGTMDQTGIDFNVHNRPMPPGSGGDIFRAVWLDILEQLDAFAPELLLISAGFDGHRLDPLADLNLETEDFVWLTEQLKALAIAHASGRMVSVLEGGYSLAALSEAVPAHVAAMA